MVSPSIVYQTEYDAAQSPVALSRSGFIDRSAFVSLDPGNVPCVCYDLAAGVPTTLLFPSAPYVVWPIIDYFTASRRIEDYFSDEDRVSVPVPGTE